MQNEPGREEHQYLSMQGTNTEIEDDEEDVWWDEDPMPWISSHDKGAALRLELPHWTRAVHPVECEKITNFLTPQVSDLLSDICCNDRWTVLKVKGHPVGCDRISNFMVTTIIFLPAFVVKARGISYTRAIAACTDKGATSF